MRAYLDEELFESDAVDPLCIVEIIAQVKEGRHQVLLRPSFQEEDERDLPRNRWLRGQSEPLRARLAALLSSLPQSNQLSLCRGAVYFTIKVSR